MKAETNRDVLKCAMTGVIASLVTPFDKRGQVSPEGMRKQVAFLIDAGVKVFVCCGSIGEFASLSVAERKAVLELTMASARADSVVVQGCASSDIGTIIELADHALVNGAHGIMVTAPYYFKSTSDEIYRFFSEIDDSVNLPYVIYNNPATTKTELSLDLIEKISGLSKFAVLKESSGDMVRYFEERKRFQGQFPIIAAAESLLIFQLLTGAEGLMTASATFAPGLMLDLWNATREYRVQEAFRLFSRLFQFRQLFNAKMASGFPSYVAYTKAALDILGIPVGSPRAPLSSLSQDEKTRLEEVLEKEMGLVSTGGC